MPQRELPARPNLEHLKKQARTLLTKAQAGDVSARARLSAGSKRQPKLADALHVLAREFGFDTWPALKFHVEAAAKDPVSAFSAAIKSNQAKILREVLTKHPSLLARINEPLPDQSFGTTALLAAVQHENRAMVDALLDAGADVNARSDWWAGSFGVLDIASPELSEHLIARGATVDIHAAARLGKIDRVRERLAVDPQLAHARGGDGQLPLHFAATVEIAALLLEHGAEIDARDIDHESTAAQYMACTRQILEWREPHRHDVARFLISRGAQTDILMASAVGDLALVEHILNHDPETVRTTATERYFPKRDSRSGGCIYFFGFGITKSPHMIAQEFGHAEVFDLLMQRSPAWLRLVNSAESGDEEAVRRTLAEHPQLFQKLSSNAARRLIGSAVRNNTRAVELLVTSGWPADPKMENNQTALHYAAWHGNAAMVNALLAHGASVHVFESEHGGSPLGWALHGSLNSWEREGGNYPAVVRALVAAGAPVPKPDRPLEATDEVLEILIQAERSTES